MAAWRRIQTYLDQATTTADWRIQTYQRHYVWRDSGDYPGPDRQLTPTQVDRILSNPDNTIMGAKTRIVQVQDEGRVGIIVAAEPDGRPAFDVLERPPFWQRQSPGVWIGAATWIVSLALGLPLV